MLSNLLESLRVLRTPCVKCRSKIIRNFSDSARKAFPELAMFSSEQEKLVLEQINERSLDDFCNTKGIGPARGKVIIEHRTEHGPFLSLADLAAIKGFGRAFFKNLLESDGFLRVARKKHNISNLLTLQEKKHIHIIGRKLDEKLAKLCPAFPSNANSISTLVSIDIGLSNAAYVHIDRNKRILDWKRISVPVPRPYSPVNCKNSVQQVVSSLPNAELYLIELQSHRASRVDPAMFPFVLHLRIVEAMFHCLLQNKLVLDMNPVVTARYFGLPTGIKKKKAAVDLISFFIKKNENTQFFEDSPDAFFEKATSMTGSKETVASILATSSINGHMVDKKWRADIPERFMEYFMAEKKKDDLSDALLQALAFLDLGLQE